MDKIFSALLIIGAVIIVAYILAMHATLRRLEHENKECEQIWEQKCTLIPIPNSHVDGIVKLLNGDL